MSPGKSATTPLTANVATTVRTDATATALIDVREVTKEFRAAKGRDGDAPKVVPLDGLSLRAGEGEFVALMGPSGSGKTTLLHLIAGIDKPTRGSVFVGGVEVSALSARQLARFRARHVGYVFQTYQLIPVLTAYENVEVPLLLLPLDRRERDAKVRTALAAVGLADRMHHLPRQLSGGQQQRVAIARAIVADPTVVLADEPTGNLDREAATATLALLGRLNAEFGKTIVMVTHDPRAAAAARRVVHLDKGRILSDGTDAADERSDDDG